MATETLIDNRLAALERDVSELKQRMSIAPTNNWLAKIAGSMEQEHDFAKVLEYGRAARRADAGSDETAR